MKRAELVRYANATDIAVEKGKVTLKDGTIHDFSAELAESVENTEFYNRLTLEKLYKRNGDWIPKQGFSSPTKPTIVFEKKFIQDAVFDATTAFPGKHIAVLNFASYKRPGGGWLKGAVAQEEAIARSSALVKTLEQSKCSPFYNPNKKLSMIEVEVERCALIFSKGVPFIRYHDEFCKPFFCSVITCAAVNVNSVGKHFTREWVEHTMNQRIKHVLNIATEYGVEVLLLGSWGTGVYGNSVEMIARLFKAQLEENFPNCFDQVQFVIPDDSTMNEFRAQFELRE